MDDALLGVIVGASIASIVPVIQICVSHYHWRTDRRLSLLDEKIRKEEALIEETLETIERGLAEDSWNTQSSAKLLSHFSVELLGPLYVYFDCDDRSDERKRKVIFDIADNMHKHISRLEKKKEKLLGA